MAGNIKGITIEIGGNTAPLEQALKKVNSTAKSTATEMKQIDKALKFNPNNIVLLTQKQEVLNKQIANTKEKLDTLKNAQAGVEAQFKAGKIGEEQYRAFKRELETTQSTLEHYQSKLSGLQKEQENLGKATSRLSGFFKATGKDVESFRNVLGDKLTDAIKQGKASSQDMEKALDLMAKEASQGKSDIKALRDALDRLDDGGSINNVKSQLESLGSQAESTSSKTDKLLTHSNLQQAAQVASQAGQKMIDFGKQTQDAFREVDAGMDIIVTKTGIVSEEGTGALKKIYEQLSVDLPVDSFEKVGSAIGEVNTQFGLYGDELQQASESIIKFSEINGSDITNSTINAKRAIEAYGLSTSDLGATLDSVTYVAQATGVSVDELFDKATTGAPQIKELGLSFSEGATLIGQLEQAGVDSSATLTAMTKATASYAKEGKSLSEGLEDSISKIKSASNSTEAFTEAAKAFGNKGAAKMVDAIQRGAFSFEDLGQTANNSIGTVSNTFEATLDPIDRQQQAANSVKLAMSELGAEISAALAPILESLIPMIKGIVEWFQNLPGPVKQFIVVLGGIIAVVGILAPIIAALVFSFSAIGATMLPIVGIIAAVIAAIAAIIAIITNWGAIVDWLGGLFEGFKSAAADVWNGITSSISNALDSAKNVMSNVMESIGSIISGIWDAITGTTSSIWDGITSTIGNAINGAKDVVGKAIEAIKNFFSFKFEWPHIPLPHFSISGSINPIDWLTQGLPSIGVEWYAKGGIMTKPTIFGQNGNNLMVGGEAGNEAILPLNDRTFAGIGAGIAAHLQGTNGIEVNIYPHELVVRDDNDLRRLALQLAEELVSKMKLKERRESRVKGEV